LARLASISKGTRNTFDRVERGRLWNPADVEARERGNDDCLPNIERAKAGIKKLGAVAQKKYGIRV